MSTQNRSNVTKMAWAVNDLLRKYPEVPLVKLIEDCLKFNHPSVLDYYSVKVRNHNDYNSCYVRVTDFSRIPNDTIIKSIEHYLTTHQ